MALLSWRGAHPNWVGRARKNQVNGLATLAIARFLSLALRGDGLRLVLLIDIDTKDTP